VVRVPDRQANSAEAFRATGFERLEVPVVNGCGLVGFDHVVSIEHEDPMVSADDSLVKAVEVLKRLLPGSP
jgi:hypothetical protein